MQIQRSDQGVSYCGFRIRQGVILPSRRKLRRYRRHMENLEQMGGELGEALLQRRADAIEATLAHSTSLGWRQRYWARVKEAPC